MKTCQLCGSEFPNWITIDGKKRNLSSRKRCLKCSPFGLHNTGKIIYKNGDTACTNCGRPYVYNKSKGHTRSVCNTCKANSRRLRIKQKMLAHLGNKCLACGYNHCEDALCFHHRNPRKKDFELSKAYRIRWSKIERELDKCDLLCLNCHAEIHARERAARAG